MQGVQGTLWQLGVVMKIPKVHHSQHLVGDAAAAVDAGAGEAKGLGEAPHILPDLLYQLPRGRHDQRHRAITLRKQMDSC